MEKMSQGHFHSENWINVQEKTKLTRVALESIIVTLQIMVTWAEASAPVEHVSEDEKEVDQSIDTSITDDRLDPTEDDPSNTSTSSTNASFADKFTQQKEMKRKLERVMKILNLYYFAKLIF